MNAQHAAGAAYARGCVVAALAVAAAAFATVSAIATAVKVFLHRCVDPKSSSTLGHEKDFTMKAKDFEFVLDGWTGIVDRAPWRVDH